MDWLEIKEFIKDTIKYVILIISVILIYVYVLSITQVIGPSMSPNFNNGDIVVLDKLYYKFWNINRGDVVLISSIESKNLIKRVIGLPGEYIEIKNNKVYIEDDLLEEHYLTNQACDNFSIKNLGYDVIPDNMYLVLGDNRNDSMDSRDSKIGLITNENVVGKVRLRIWPLNRIKIV